MSSLNSMKQKLKPLGFYNLSGENSLVNAELNAYAEALDSIEASLNEIEKECFISTAESYGLGMRERMFGAEQNNINVNKRREILIYRCSINSNSFNKESIEKALEVAGINGYIIEVPNKNLMYINCLSLYDNTLDKTKIKNIIEEYLPAHLDCIFDFRNLKWDTIDSNDKTFNEMDSKNLTWNSIDNFDEI